MKTKASSSNRISGGTVHKLPADLRQALRTTDDALKVWSDITPLARNEWICWVEQAKQLETRKRRIKRAQEDLASGASPLLLDGLRSSY